MIHTRVCISGPTSPSHFSPYRFCWHPPSILGSVDRQILCPQIISLPDICYTPETRRGIIGLTTEREVSTYLIMPPITLPMSSIKGTQSSCSHFLPQICSRECHSHPFFSSSSVLLLTLLYKPIQPQRCKPPQRLTAMVALSTAVLFSLVSLAVASSHHHKMGIRHHRRQSCNANPNSGNGTNLASGNNTSPPQKGGNHTTPLPNGTNSTSPPQNGGNNTSQLQLLDHYHGQDFMNEE